jgi:hypothetical protein
MTNINPSKHSKSSQNSGGLALTHLATFPLKQRKRGASCHSPTTTNTARWHGFDHGVGRTIMILSRVLRRSPDRGASGVLCALVFLYFTSKFEIQKLKYFHMVIATIHQTGGSYSIFSSFYQYPFYNIE